MAATFGAKIVPFGAVGEDDLAQVIKLQYLFFLLRYYISTFCLLGASDCLFCAFVGEYNLKLLSLNDQYIPH